MPERSQYLPHRLRLGHLRLFAIMLAGVAVFGVIDGSLWKSLLSPTLAYRPAFLFGVTLLFGWRGLICSQILFLASFTSFFGWRGVVFVEPLYLLSHACGLVVARRLAGKEPWLSRERSTLAFLAGAAIAPALPALFNEPMLRVLGIPFRAGVPPAIEAWLRGGAGMLALAPAVLVYGAGRLNAWVGQPTEQEWQLGNARDAWELGLEIVAWTATLWISVAFKARYGLNVTYVTFLPPLALTLRRGMRLAAPALAANAVLATTLWNQLHWADSLSAGDLRLLIAFYSLAILVLAAVVDERQRAHVEIGQRKQAETALRESEQRFRALADSAPVMIWVSGPDQLCTFFNQPWLNFTGRTMEQELGDGWTRGVHPEDLDRCQAIYSTSFEARRSFQMEYRLRRADGEFRWILDNGVPLSRDGQFTGYIGSCVDVTGQKLATEMLQASEIRLRYAQRLAQVGSWERHLETGKYYWSDEKLRIFGLPEGTPLDLDGFLSFVDPKDRDKVRECALEACASTAPVEVEYRIVRPDRERRIVRSIIEGIRNEQGEVVRLVGATQDVTDIRRSQEEAFARQKLETLGTLANGIAHDFNNLLGGVVAQAEMALAELTAGSLPEEELKAICDVGMRGSEIVRELMIYAGTESESLRLMDVSQTVEQMLELLKVSVSKHAAIEADLGRDLSPVLANPARISQLVMNLVANASEALGNRDGIIRVVTRRGAGDCLQLIVSDNGCGIPPEMQARVFDPFFSTKSTSRGLGLAVVQGIVRSLGGAIHLASEPGHGTTITISLPSADGGSENTHSPAVTTEEPASPSPPATVLVVEDEKTLRHAVSKMLSKSGFTVIEAPDGSAALDAIREPQQAIDILFLDITLPGIPSREVFEAARRLRPRMKVIVTSAYTEEMATASLQGGVERFLRKPYRLGDLAGLIQQALS